MILLLTGSHSVVQLMVSSCGSHKCGNWAEITLCRDTGFGAVLWSFFLRRSDSLGHTLFCMKNNIRALVTPEVAGYHNANLKKSKKVSPRATL